MQYPELRIDKAKFAQNVRTLKNFLDEKGMKYHLVTKMFRAHEAMIKVMAEEGIKNFADSRIDNLKRLKPYAESILLTRMPMLSEVDDAVKYSDISLNSELVTVKALNQAAKKQNKVHGVIAMCEMGDLREGMEEAELLEFVKEVDKLENIELKGLGVNFNCYGGVIPDEGKMLKMAELRKKCEAITGKKHELLSAGNSGSLHLLLKDKMPEECDHLRLGESYLLARETSYGEHLFNMHEDVFTLRAEVIESKIKNSLPDGETGLNAAGEKQKFEDRGRIVRTIVALGGQDMIPAGIKPVNHDIDFIGNSADHAIFDTTKYSDKPLEIGSKIDLRCNYVALTAAFTSEYVVKTVF